MTHIRHRHESQFTVVGNHLAQHPTLSAVAIGVAVRIQSLPDGAKVGVKVLAAQFPEGEGRIARALQELEEAGYLARKKERAVGQRIVTRTTYFEHPTAARAARAAKARPVPAPEPVPVPAPVPEAPREVPLPGPPGSAPVNSPVSPPVVLTKKPVPPAPTAAPAISPRLRRAATAILAGLRAKDARLVLSERDIAFLVPGVARWLDRGVPPEQVFCTLSGSLPPGVITWPSKVLHYRLTQWLPPVLPPSSPADAPPPTASRHPAPLQNCNGCDRAFRSPSPGRCRDCRGGI
ncbi:helix-turn-helix domain-containing protein [Streptomyces sp. NPDC050610]|uniref:helix-turn-helix domain-containing protein n=1 Tax=Streptomyces sp. NPDC050610 TaxID=3157097 RepID=UPI003449E722